MCHTAKSTGASQTQERHRSPMLLIGVITTVFMLGVPKGKLKNGYSICLQCQAFCKYWKIAGMAPKSNRRQQAQQGKG